MAVKINFNAEATKTHTALIYNERLMGKSLLRLSTGYRILNAADDSAGLFIADMLGTVAAALEQGNANIQTGISALQIAESSAGQIYTKLQEIYVRAQRAANDINDPNARSALQQEITNFVDAIDKIATDTEYNGIKLLDGTFTGKYIHYGPRMNQAVSVSISSLRATELGAYTVEGNISDSARRATSGSNNYANLLGSNLNFRYNSATDKLIVADVDLSSNFSDGNAVDAKTIADAINTNTTLQKLGITASVSINRTVADEDFGSITLDAGESLTIKIFVGKDASSSVVNITLTGGAGGTNYNLSYIVDEINTQASNAGSSLRADISNGALVLQTSGETIGIEVTNNSGDDFNLSKLFPDGPTISDGNTGSGIQVGRLIIGGVDLFSYDLSGLTGNNAEGLALTSPSGSATGVSLNEISVLDNPSAEEALMIVTKAMQKTDKIRAQIGATMNNLQSIFDSQKVAYDNTKEAESVIRNTDYAKEMSEFVTYQIRMQATVAMLAQANTLPQLVLQLMR